MPGGMRPFFVRFYAAGLISAVGILAGVPVSSGDAVGAEEASGVAVGFAFSRDALMASSNIREVYLLSEEYVTRLKSWVSQICCKRQIIPRLANNRL